MANFKEHCNSCRIKYGYDFGEVHEWMDEPVKLYGPSHRKERHDKDSTPAKAEIIFKKQVPADYRLFIRDAVIDHLLLDYRQEQEDVNKCFYQFLEKINKDPSGKLLQKHVQKINGCRISCEVAVVGLAKKLGSDVYSCEWNFTGKPHYNKIGQEEWKEIEFDLPGSIVRQNKLSSGDVWLVEATVKASQKEGTGFILENTEIIYPDNRHHRKNCQKKSLTKKLTVSGDAAK